MWRGGEADGGVGSEGRLTKRESEGAGGGVEGGDEADGGVGREGRLTKTERE